MLKFSHLKPTVKMHMNLKSGFFHHITILKHIHFQVFKAGNSKSVPFENELLGTKTSIREKIQ